MNKRALLALAMCALSLFAAAAKDSSPIASWGDSSSHCYEGSRHDRSYRDCFNEQDGYAIVRGRAMHYWLYDTIENHDGNASMIYNEVVPKWIENMGYVIDFDNIRKYDPNEGLATSVMKLMAQRDCDVSVALVTDEPGADYVAINECFSPEEHYTTTIYPLYRR